MVSSRALWSVSVALALAIGFLAGNGRASWEYQRTLDSQSQDNAHQAQRFTEATMTLAEQVHRVREAYNTSEPSLGIHISTLESHVRRMQHLPDEKPTGVEP